jgi:hypothetical protein
VTAASDDDQPTAAVGDVDATAVVADSPRTVAAELHSEAPTTMVPDVRPTQSAELSRKAFRTGAVRAERPNVFCYEVCAPIFPRSERSSGDSEEGVLTPLLSRVTASACYKAALNFGVCLWVA